MKSLALILLWACIALNATAQSSGLTYNYYEGSWDYLPNFSTLTAVKTGASPNISLSARNRELQYAFVWKGQLRVPLSGTYTFETISDDGSQLFVGNSAAPVVNNDGLHGSQTAKGTIYLNAGTYPITISFFQQAGLGTMEMYWSSNTGLSREKIPNSAFTTAPASPATPPVAKGLSGVHNYYISSSTGDDSRTAAQAQSSSTPWKSLARVNAFFHNMLPGDAVLLKRGDTFNEQLKIGKSGTAAAPFIVSAYGSGAKPVINGFNTLSNWTAVGNGIYQSACNSCKPTLNTVVINGAIKAKGRYPNPSAANKGYLNWESHSGNTSITDHALASFPNWTGGEVVTRKEQWNMDKNPITNHSGSTITYIPQSDYTTRDGWGYFIQNHPATLDLAGEWYFEPTSKKLQVYFGASPAGNTVQASVIDTLVNLNGNDYVTIDNIEMNGADQTGLQIDNSIGAVIQNCDINNSGINGINGEYTYNLMLLNNTVNNSLTNGINLVYWAYDDIVRGNVIKNSGVFPGMGRSGDGTYCGIQVYLGKNNLIEYNEVDSSGYIGIGFYGDSIIIKNNFVNYFDLTKQDGGGIYACAHNNGDPINNFGKKIIGNIVMNGIGAVEGTNNHSYIPSDGIYIDNRNTLIDIMDNTVANCAQSGIFNHESHHLTITGNTMFNNGTQIMMNQGNTSPNDPIRNNIVKNNIAFANAAGQFVGIYRSPVYDVAQFGNFDSNYYSKPVDVLNLFHTVMNGEFKFYNYSAWRTAYSHYDPNAKQVVSTAPRFEYNATRSTKTIQLDATYVDVKGNVYSNSVTLAPYTSVILTRTSNSAPVAKAGADVAITLPVNLVTLNGTASYDVDNNITTYKWTKISGPATCTFSERYVRKPTVSALTPGTYTFTLLVTDRLGAASTDTMKVTVQPAMTMLSQSESNVTGTLAATAEADVKAEVKTAVATKEVKQPFGLALYPNPVVDVVTLSNKDGREGNLAIIMTNAAGNVLSSRNVVKHGALNERFNVQSLVPGVYYLQVKYADGSSATRPFVKN